MVAVAVVGAQWGDEGKGKIVDLLSAEAEHVVRAQGGNNAGHTVIIGTAEYKLHLIPSGILHPHTQCYIGAGTVLDPEVLIQEMKTLEAAGVVLKGRLHISTAAHVIFPYHRQLDSLIEKKKGNFSVGTTGRGIGPCYADKANRFGIRMGDLVHETRFPVRLKEVLAFKNEELEALFSSPPLLYESLLKQYQEYAKFLKPYIGGVEEAVHMALEKGKNMLFEGAQGTFLDLNCGTYPYVTSSNTTAAGICAGASIGPGAIDHTVGVIKAYATRVGAGPFPTEIRDEECFLDHKEAREYGTTTGRKRRVGWFDAVMAAAAVRYNSLDSLALTKLDILDNVAEIKICTGYELNGKIIGTVPLDAEELENVVPVYERFEGWMQRTGGITAMDKLPANAQRYLRAIEQICGIPISILSVGPEREKTIILKDLFHEMSHRS